VPVFSTDLNTRGYEGCAVVALGGKLDMADAAAVTGALTAVAARGLLIIVDLAALEFIDASGTLALARGRRQARRAGGDLVLAVPQRVVMRVLAIIPHDQGFGVYASVEEAAGKAGRFTEKAIPVPQRPEEARWPELAWCPGTHDLPPLHSSRMPSVPDPSACRFLLPAAAAPEA